MMYQIMSSINWSEETKGRVKTKIKELNEQFEGEKGVSMFGTSLGKQWKTYDSDERYSTASLRFNSTDIETSIRKTEVVFEPTETGKEYTIDQMGDGLRSLFYISRAKASVTFTFCKKRSGMKCPMQRHNAINEFFDLLQRPGIAEVKRFQNR